MATTPAIVLTIKCGETLKTTIGGVAVEIECQGDAGGGWTLPNPPEGGGGVVAYVTAAEVGYRLDLSQLVNRFQEGTFNVEDLPAIDPGHEWAVFTDPTGNVRSMREMTTEE